MSNNFISQLSLLLKSRQNILFLKTQEELRVEFTLRNFIKQSTKRAFFSWDFATGYNHIPNTNKIASKNPFQALKYIEQLDNEFAFFIVIKDFHNFLDDLLILRQIKILTKQLKGKPGTIVFLIPNSFNFKSKDFFDTNLLFEFPLPTKSEIGFEIQKLLKYINLKLEKKNQENLINACLGLNLETIRYILVKNLIYKNLPEKKAIQSIYGEKIKILNENQLLQYWENELTFNDIGGLQELKNWLELRKLAFSSNARQYGLPNLKGILLIGEPGTGKSLAAKAISGELNLPLLQFDIGKIFGSVIGESELRMREMINISETLSPCIIWIDEIDKAFTKTSNSGDSGTSQRVLGTFLTWLAEKKSGVFIVATANNIENFPSEMFRKGRFDKTFVIEFPNEIEREKIFEILLKKIRPSTWRKFNYKKFAKKTGFFNGAEINQIITDAMYKAFSEGREFTNEDIFNEIESFKLQS